ncbi:3-hydroxybutyryl-CoA dehydrogenase, partial [Streptomyces sp. SID3343]
MGAGIAQSFAAAGFEVVVAESNEQAAAAARERIAVGLRRAAERDGLAEPVEAVLTRVATVRAIDGLPAAADLIVEA